MGQGRQTLTSIQVLRAVAALGVVAWHLASEVNTSGGQMPDFYIGQAGVDLFFVISGFVMVVSSRPLFGAPGAAATFLARRAIRIVPLYWATSSVLLIHTLARHPDLHTADLSWQALAASYLFIPVPRPGGEWTPLHKVGWTLNYEMAFYILFATALAFRRAVALASVIGVVLGIAVISAIVWPGAQTIAVWPSPIIAEFAFGVAIGAAYVSGARLSPSATIILLSAGSALLFGLHAANVAGPRVLVWGLPVSLMVAAATLSRAEAHQPGWAWLARLGDTSYALYLVHPFMLLPRLIAQRAFGIVDGPWSQWPLLYAIILMIGSIAAALVVHRYFEQPATDFLKGLLLRRTLKQQPAE